MASNDATWASWGYSALSGMAKSIGSALGYESLEVVDPNGQGARGPVDQRRSDLFGQIRGYLGKDVMSMVSVPVWVMEPFSTLQKMAEIMEHPEYLNKAVDCEDPIMRAAFVAAFSVSMYGCLERTWKPFNPILGETFEHVDTEAGYHWISEQVSHHPPIGVGIAEHKRWRYEIISAPETKFLGNSIEIYPIGRTRIYLKEQGETYFIVPPPTKANNIVVGGMWLDSYGTLTIGCGSGVKSVLEFTQCGWTGAGRYQFSGYVYDASGVRRIKLWGKWNTHMDCQPCDAEGSPLEGTEPTRLWNCKPKPQGDKYNFTHFAHRLNSFEGITPLASDSRRRPDRLALEKGDSSSAQRAKYELEERQRAERKERGARGEHYEPRFFVKRTPPGYQVFEGERSLEQLPGWDWKGTPYEPKAVTDASPAATPFSPWQYPDLNVEAGPEGEAGPHPEADDGAEVDEIANK